VFVREGPWIRKRGKDVQAQGRLQRQIEKRVSLLHSGGPLPESATSGGVLNPDLIVNG
jgi:hypothetical protein